MSCLNEVRLKMVFRKYLCLSMRLRLRQYTIHIIWMWIECIDKHAHDTSAFCVIRYGVCVSVSLYVYQYWLCKIRVNRTFRWFRKFECTFDHEFAARTTCGSQLQDLPLNYFIIDFLEKRVAHSKSIRSKLNENSIFSFTFHYSYSLPCTTCRRAATVKP